MLDRPGTMADNAGMDSLVCQLCGRVAQHSTDESSADESNEADPRLSWVMDREGDRISWTCPSCAVENVRAMEAKLDAQWW